MQNKKLKNKALFNLLAFKRVLDSLGIPFCLDGGTLLGAWRDKDFCDDDCDDVDLTTQLIHFDLADDIIALAEQVGLPLYHRWDGDDTHTPQISFKKDNLKIDLMFKSFKGDKAWWTIYAGKKATYKCVPAEHFSKGFETIDFLGNKFLVPHDTPGYLTLRYGDWKTPVHRSKYSCYSSDKCIVGSYEEI